MNYLALDYGTKHVGIAVASTPIAEPLKTVSIDAVLAEVTVLVDEMQIDKIIVGISERHMADKTKHFALELNNQVDIPIIFHDETLSSRETGNRLRHARKSIRRGPDHHFAAAVFLQDFLDHET